MNILIAIDDSECSAAAVESVASQSWPEDAQFLILTVVEPVTYECAVGAAYMASMEEARKEFYEHCGELVGSKGALLKRATGREVVGKVREGAIASTIVDEAKDWDADLIVLGSHGRTGFQKFLLGSVAEKVSSHAPCSVEIIKQKLLSQNKRQGADRTAVVSGRKRQD